MTIELHLMSYELVNREESGERDEREWELQSLVAEIPCSTPTLFHHSIIYNTYLELYPNTNPHPWPQLPSPIWVFWNQTCNCSLPEYQPPSWCYKRILQVVGKLSYHQCGRPFHWTRNSTSQVVFALEAQGNQAYYPHGTEFLPHNFWPVRR